MVQKTVQTGCHQTEPHHSEESVKFYISDYVSEDSVFYSLFAENKRLLQLKLYERSDSKPKQSCCWPDSYISWNSL